ncbi:MAG: toxin-antitoxin system YwqK family antitoxin [Rhodoferax sp.]|nr:toxin-antitoxin system YwqK family antitoxin [Rhodoferax sp.]
MLALTVPPVTALLPPVVNSAVAAPGLAQMAMQEVVDDGGNLLCRTSYVNGLRDGSMEATYQAGKLQGALRLYDAKGGVLQVREHVNDLPHGITRTNYPSGKPLLEQQFVQGVAQGESVAYAESGEPIARMQYVAGQLEGESIYLTEGRVVRRARYRAGLLDGEVVDYGANGAPTQTAQYRANLLNGVLRRFWPNGQVLEEIEYRKGKPVGVARRFDQNGMELVVSQQQPGFMKSLEKLVRGG